MSYVAQWGNLNMIEMDAGQITIIIILVLSHLFWAFIGYGIHKGLLKENKELREQVRRLKDKLN